MHIAGLEVACRVGSTHRSRSLRWVEPALHREFCGSTYAGKLALCAGDAGAVDNPSRTVPKRIGLAVDGNDRAIGAAL